MQDLNYRHLRYFQEVAHDGNLTRTAGRLNLSQSALSTQIRQLEARLGHDLFDRKGRQLVLTEAGRIALDHADRIFAAGADLTATLAQRDGPRRPLRVGALSTLSRNFQMAFLRPLAGRPDVDLVLRSGNANTLLDALEALALDIVLTTETPSRDALSDFVATPLGDRPVRLFGRPERLDHPTLSALLSAEPVILPTESSIRTGFDTLVARLGIRPRIAAEVDDMAMVRLLARENVGLAVVPEVVVGDELRAGRLAAAPHPLDIVERFFAVTVPRRFPNPLIAELLPPMDGPETAERETGW